MRKVAWIIGASSGIGESLAFALANSGYSVCASARRTEKLQSLQTNNKKIIPYPLDCAAPHTVKNAAQQIIKNHGHIDLIIYGAVFSGNRAQSTKELENALSVGILGCTAMVEATLPALKQQKSAQIAIIGSPVGFNALPGATRYGTDKAALHYYAKSLRLELATSNIDIKLILPGFVATPLTAQNKFAMPFLMTSEAAAQRIIRGLKNSRFEIAFPKRLIWPMKALNFLPSPIYFWLMRHLAKSIRT